MEPRALELRWMPILILFGIGVSSVFAGPKKPLHVPLVYRPTSTLKLNVPGGTSALTKRAVQVIAIADEREKKGEIGSNIEKKTPVQVLTDEKAVPVFVRERIVGLLKEVGVKVVDEPGAQDRVLAIKLHKLWVQESNTYQTDIRVSIEMRDVQGAVMGELLLSGANKKFGRSLSVENYQETISDALIDLVEKLLHDSAFLKAMEGT